MLYLLYCIMKAPVVDGAPAMAGVTGKAVSFITAHGLVAAISELDAVKNAPPVAELVVYGRVIEELFRMQAVVPMRYGCVLDGMPAVSRLLEEKKREYGELLDELDGHVEMGIRILLPEQMVKPRPEVPPADGCGYLAMRKAHYSMRDQHSLHHQALMERYVQAFSGLQCEHRAETATRDGAIILSLYYLVPKSQVGLFREIFQRAVEQEGSKTLISGPWPPYNFAAPEIAPEV
ncbi:MAG: GvpL/GvpF family gas vesicle protein [bacterium]